MKFPLRSSSSTRNRTWTRCLEDSYDFHFTIEPFFNERKARDSNPQDLGGRTV